MKEAPLTAAERVRSESHPAFRARQVLALEARLRLRQDRHGCESDRPANENNNVPHDPSGPEGGIVTLAEPNTK
jgi:hypothetical protein